MSERLNKRLRLGPYRFLDIEASIDDDSDDESDPEGWHGSLSPLEKLTSRILDNVGVDDSEYLDSTSTHRSLAQAMHDAEQSGDWDSFLRRAKNRGRLGNTSNEKQEDLAPKVGEHLWEIGCKVRCYVLVHTFFS